MNQQLAKLGLDDVFGHEHHFTGHEYGSLIILINKPQALLIINRGNERGALKMNDGELWGKN